MMVMTIGTAKSRYVRISPHKLRPLIDGVRGKSLVEALNWLASNPCQKAVPVIKVLNSAWSNAKNLGHTDVVQGGVIVSVATVNQGPTFKYSKPGSQGRGVMCRKRLSHLEVCLAKRA